MIIITPIVVSWMVLTIVTELGIAEMLYLRISKYYNLKQISGYMTCWKCVTFWTALLLGDGFVSACLSAFIAYFVELVIERIEE